MYNARLVRREDETDSLAYVWVRFDGDATPFEPGQYMTIGVFADGRLVQRPYSVASSPRVAGTDGYEFYVRLVQGGQFTPLLWRLPIGHRMRMIGPKGKFTLEPDDDRTHLFISTGTGNAPFVVDDEDDAPRRRAAPRRSSSTASRTRTSSATATLLEDWESSGDVPGHASCPRSRDRPIRATPAGRAGSAGRRRSSATSWTSSA